MTEPTTDARAALIKKLLNKAEAKGATPEERDAYNAKATMLMLQWGIEEAVVANADRAKIENIVQKVFRHDAPKSYSYEMTLIGIEVANAIGCKGILQKARDGRVDLLVVGFESDVDRVQQLFVSLMLQCTLSLGPWFGTWVNEKCYQPSGTEKFNAKRSFIRGFANGVRTKLAAVKSQVVKDAAPGTDLVLVDRAKQVDAYISSEMHVGLSRARRYGANAGNAGRDAGMRADIGGSKVGGSRTSIGG